MTLQINNNEFNFFQAIIKGDVPKTALFLKEIQPKHYFSPKLRYKKITADKYSTPIHLACSLGMIAITELIFQSANNNYSLLSLRNYIKQDTVLHMMIRCNQFELFQLLYYTKQDQFKECLNIKNTRGYTPFLLASKHQDLRYVELLVQAGSLLDEENLDRKGALELIFSSQHFRHATFDFKNTAYYKHTQSDYIYNYFEKFMRFRFLLHAFAKRQNIIYTNLKLLFPAKTNQGIFETIQSYECNPRLPAFNKPTQQNCLQALTLPFAIYLINTIHAVVSHEWRIQTQKKQYLGSVSSFEVIAIQYLDKTTPCLNTTSKQQLASYIKYGVARIEQISAILIKKYQFILPELLSVDLPLFQEDWAAWKNYLQKRG